MNIVISAAIIVIFVAWTAVLWRRKELHHPLNMPACVLGIIAAALNVALDNQAFHIGVGVLLGVYSLTPMVIAGFWWLMADESRDKETNPRVRILVLISVTQAVLSFLQFVYVV